MNKKNIAILGSTGSVGTQALEVIECFPDHFSVSVLSIGKNADLLIQQVQKFHPKIVVVGDEAAYQKVKTALKDVKTEVWFGQESLSRAVELEEIDIVLTAIVGSAGLQPTLTAIEHGKDIALANKETLVVAGELIKELVAKK
ncbi:MAG: 1-deoxy-D-xylulose-5-phosphate reductoisomerase, partial [Sphingobacterium sp.]